MTEQKQNSPRTAQTYPSMKSIMDASPMGIVAFDSDARIVYINPLAAQLFGKSAIEVSGIKCGDLIDCANCHMDLQGCGHTKSCPACPLFNAIGATLSDESNSGIQEGETFLKRDAGLTNIWVKYKVSSVMMEGSKVAIMTFEDITGYKQDQEKLRNALAELSVIHEHAPIAMMMVDKDRRIRKINGFAARLAGRSASEMIGLRGGEAKYRVLIKNTNDIIYTLDSSGIFTFVSPGWTVLLGHDVSEVEGKDFRHFVHPDDIGKCEDFF